MERKWYTRGIDDVAAELKTNAASGLDRKAARSRLKKTGGNSFFFVGTRSFFGCVKAVLADPMLLILIGVVFIAAVFGRTSIAIGAGMVILASLSAGIVFSVISQRRIESMSGYSQPKLRVIRGGELFLADARCLVPGDLIIVGEGDIIPCDARLVSADRFSVRVFTGNEEGGYVRVNPDAAAVYDADTVLPIHEQLNMLYAGSSVITGEARAIVVETGEYTYIGALDGGMPLNDPSAKSPILRELRKFSRTYSLAVLLMIIPLTVIGILTYGPSSMLSTFMLVLSLAVSSLGETVYVAGNIIVATGFTHCASGNGKSGGAMIKTPEALTDIASTDRLFLLGDAAITDGKLRIVSAYAGSCELSGHELFDGRLMTAAESLTLVGAAALKYPVAVGFADSVFAEGTEDFCVRLGVDRKAISIRATILDFSVEGGRVSTRVNDGGTIRTITVSEGDELLGECNLERIGGGFSEFDITKHYKAETALGRMTELGCRSLTVISVLPSGERIFEGIFGYKTAVSRDAKKKCAELRAAGVLPVLFLEGETRREVMLSEEAGIVSSAAEIAFASECRKAGIPIPPAEGRYKAYLGFSRQEICSLTAKTREAGHIVTVFGTGPFDITVASRADDAVTCDRADYGTGKDDVEKLETSKPSGKGTSPDGAQILRYESDVLVKRAGLRGGGLEGLLNAFACARNINYGLRGAVTYLLISQALRLSFSIPAILTGASVFSPVQLLYSGLIIDFCAMLIFANDRPDASTMAGGYRPVTLKVPLREDRVALISAGAAGLAGALIAVLMELIGGIKTGGAAFIGLILAQYIALFTVRSGKRIFAKFTPVSAIITAVSALPVLVFSLIGGLSEITGMQWSPVSLVIIFVVPTVFLLLYHTLRRKKRNGTSEK